MFSKAALPLFSGGDGGGGGGGCGFGVSDRLRRENFGLDDWWRVYIKRKV